MLGSHPGSRAHARHAAGLVGAGGAARARVNTLVTQQHLRPAVSVLSLPQKQDRFDTNADRHQSADDTQASAAPGLSYASAAECLRQQQQQQQQQQQVELILHQKSSTLVAAAAAAAATVPTPAAAASAGSTARATTAVLGSLPGVTWHYRRRGRVNGAHGNTAASSISSSGVNTLSSTEEARWNVRYAAAAILSALDSNSVAQPASGTNSSSSSSDLVSKSSATEVAANGASADTWPAEQLPAAEKREQEQEQEQEQQQAQQQQFVVLDFSLLERRASHSDAGSSGRDAALHCSSGDSSSSSKRAAQQQLFSSLDDLLLMRQGPAANFRDPGFEQALSRWVKEAPDWFKVRSVYERFGWRFNIITFACCFSRLADLFEPLGNRRMLRKERAALKQFLQQLTHNTAAVLPSVDEGTAAALLGSWARLVGCGKMQHSPQVVASLLQHITPQLGGMKPKELVGMLWAMARLKYQPGESWMDSFFDATQKGLPLLRADEVAVLIRGLAGAQAGPPPQAWLSALLAHAEVQLEIMEPQQIAMMLIGLANMQVLPRQSWMDAAMAALRSKFDSMGPQSFSNVIWALVLMGYLPDRSWLAAYFNAALILLNSFNPKELAVTMWAVSKARLEPSDEWLDEYFDQSEAKLTGFSLRDLCLCGYSLAKLGLRPPQTWLRRYCTLLLRLKSGLWHQKMLLTQALVALDSFKVPRMDMWRRELYAAAGYKLYTYPNWRQRVKVPQTPTPVPFSSRQRFGRFGRRNRGLNFGAAAAGVPGGARSGFGSSGEVGLKQGVSGMPVALRSGDWGVMDFGGLGSMMGSYEELGSGTSSSTNNSSSNGTVGSTVASVDFVSSSSSSAISSRDEATGSMDAGSRRAPASGGAGAAAATARPTAIPQGWSNQPAAVSPRPLKGPGLVRPVPPATPAAVGGASIGAAAAAAGPSASVQQQQQQQIEVSSDVSAHYD